MMHYLPIVAVSVFLLCIALDDVTGRRMPLAWMAPLIAIVAAWRLSRQELVFLAFWSGVILFWRLRFYQGWDAEVLLLLFALWPDPWLLVGICLTTALMIGSILWWRYRGRLHFLWYWWRARLRTGAWLPSPAELADGEPIAFLFSAVGIAYAWLIGVGLCGA